jgi:hypothetical protein
MVAKVSKILMTFVAFGDWFTNNFANLNTALQKRTEGLKALIQWTVHF